MENRRPLTSRDKPWAQVLARWFAQRGISPNGISCVSVVFAGIGAFALWKKPDAAGLLIAAVCIQARLLCNLLDGMVAVEFNKKSPNGALFNEFPDRIADSLLLIALGYGVGFPGTGWLAALAAMATAYVRVFGGALGLTQDFRGPMAKQHRMAVLTVACLAGMVESALAGSRYALIAGLLIIAAGSLVTCLTRTAAIARQLKQG